MDVIQRSLGVPRFHRSSRRGQKLSPLRLTTQLFQLPAQGWKGLFVAQLMARFFDLDFCFVQLTVLKKILNAQRCLITALLLDLLPNLFDQLFDFGISRPDFRYEVETIEGFSEIALLPKLKRLS